MAILIALAVFPSIYLLLAIYKQDKIEKEPSSLIIKLFIFGGIAAFLAGTLEEYGQSVLNLFTINNDRTYIILFAFLVVGVIEEGLKFIFLKKLTWNHPAFNYRFDAIVYAVSISLGFAALENILYVFSYGLSVVIPRALLAIPAHTGFAVFMGSYYGRAKLAYEKDKKSYSNWLLFLGYTFAVFLHGFYDACAMINEPVFTYIFMVFVVLMYIIVIRKVRKESKTDSLV
ncbi:MAG TPA: PrsW family glutamic-type intramembrane protease [Anaerovoracaceae bacterium]|nr:PrsW family glutamic-type intramembrane protease [Anaerovoracaceae bacterium]